MNLPIKNSNNTMNLMTKTLAKKIPGIGGQCGYQSKPNEVVVYAKFFAGGFTWYLTEMNLDTGECFGIIFSHMCPDGELGYFSMVELSQLRVPPLGTGVERDMYFNPTTLDNVKNPLQ